MSFKEKFKKVVQGVKEALTVPEGGWQPQLQPIPVRVQNNKQPKPLTPQG